MSSVISCAHRHSVRGQKTMDSYWYNVWLDTKERLLVFFNYKADFVDSCPLEVKRISLNKLSTTAETRLSPQYMGMDWGSF